MGNMRSKSQEPQNISNTINKYHDTHTRKVMQRAKFLQPDIFILDPDTIYGYYTGQLLYEVDDNNKWLLIVISVSKVLHKRDSNIGKLVEKSEFSQDRKPLPSQIE